MPPLPLMILPRPTHPRPSPPAPPSQDSPAVYDHIPKAAVRGPQAALRTGLFSRPSPSVRPPRMTKPRVVAPITESHSPSFDTSNRCPGPDLGDKNPSSQPPRADGPTSLSPEPTAASDSAQNGAAEVGTTGTADDDTTSTETADDDTPPCKCENIVDTIHRAREERRRKRQPGAPLPPAASTGRLVCASPKTTHDWSAAVQVRARLEEKPQGKVTTATATATAADRSPRAGRRVPPRFYTRAHVLTVHWATSASSAPPPAVRALKSVARRIYGYGVSHCALPASPDAAGILAGSLSTLVHGLDGGGTTAGDSGEGGGATLLVVHYAGPSRTDATTFHIHPPAWPFCAPPATVDLQHLLRQTVFGANVAADVLVLLDCAYAAGPSLGVPLEGKEILAASAEATMSAGWGGWGGCAAAERRLGFTRGLARVMEGSTWSVHVHTDELEAALGRRAMGLDEVAALVVGCGPARRHVLVAPVVTPWWYWRGVSRVVDGGGAWGGKGGPRCRACGRLGVVGSVVHRRVLGNVGGHTWEDGDKGCVEGDIELDELVENKWLR